jgi:hypothetical protein
MQDEVNASHRRYAVNLSILFAEVPLLQRPAAARDVGVATPLGPSSPSS